MSAHGTFYELGSFEIPGIPGQRAVRMFLPPVPPPYHVLYMWDAQNLFGDEGSYSGGWHAHEVLTRLARRGRPTAAVVAINHGGEHRIGDYAPVSDAKYGEGRADRMLEFVVNVLKPQVDRHFRVRPEREATFVGGSSMGALISLYALLRHPQVFGGALAMSPSLWFGGGALMKMAEGPPLDPSTRIYIDLGEREMGPFGLFLVKGLGQTLHNRGLDRRHLRVRVDPKGRHNEADWRRRLPMAVNFLLRSLGDD